MRNDARGGDGADDENDDEDDDDPISRNFDVVSSAMPQESESRKTVHERKYIEKEITRKKR